MSDDLSRQEFSNLENELRQFRPAIPAGDLHTRLAQLLASDSPHVRLSPADRCLAGAMSMGLAACLLIAGMLGMDALNTPRSAPAEMYAQSPVMAQTREFLAQLAAGYDTQLPVATAPN